MDIKLINGAQSVAARAMLGMKQADLAKAAGLAGNTIINFENANRPATKATALAIRAALEGHGIRFVFEDGHIGVLMPAQPKA